MVAEACQDTEHVYISYSGYGDITIQSNDCDPPIATLITITDPWSNNHTDQIMSIGTIKTFTSGSEVYTVEMTDMFCGIETTWSDYTECWYTEDGNRYVKTSGLDSAIGNNWANAWLTMGYGFQNIPSGKDLYVEEGLYGGETLSNLDPPQTMKMYIQPDGHTEAQCNVWISDETVFSDGDFSIGTVSNWATSGITIIDPFQTIGYNGILKAFSYYAANPGTRNGKLKIFRDGGTNYNYIGESELFSFTGSSPGTLHDYNKCNVAVQAGDIIGIYLDGEYLAVNNVGSNFLVSKSGDITSNSTKASWSTSGSHRTPMKVGVRGFK